MNRVEQFKLFDVSKSIVIAVDNKLPILDASNLYNLPSTGNVSLSGLLFKVPTIDDDAVVYNLYIEFSEDGTFNSTTTYNTTDSSHRSLFKVFTGQQLTDFPDAGVSIPFSDEIITFDISSIDKSLKYFRFRWNNGFDFGRYGFGKTDGLLQIFDSGSSSSKVEVGTGLSGDGTSGNPLNLDLDSYITTGSINLQGLNIELISDGNFIVKGTSFNIGTSETSIPIVLNGNAQNTAGGVVVLETGNKLPAIDGSQLINLPTSGLSSVSVGSGLTGNGTSSSPIKLDLSNYSTDDSIYVTSKGFSINAGDNNIDFAINEGNNRFRVLVGDVAGTTNQECIFDVSQPYIHLLAHGTSYVGIEVPTIDNLKLKISDRSDWSSPNTANGFVVIGSDGKIPSNLYNAGSSINWENITEPIVSFGSSGSNIGSFSVYSDNITLEGSTIAFSSSSAPTLNGHSANTAGGFVILDDNGKIPSNLYDAGTGGLTDLSDYNGKVNIKSSFVIEIDSGDVSMSLKGSDLYWNNRPLNSSNGLVKLGADGKIPSNLYDAGGLTSISVGSGLSGNGTSSSPLVVDLSNYNSSSISLNAPDVSILGSNVIIGTGTANNIYLKYESDAPSSSIYVNNNALNTAGGLVLLGSDGKIPEDLYDKGTLEPTEIKPLLIELNGTNSSSDGIVVSYDNENYLVTITHNLNSYVNGILFDETGKQAFFGIDYVDNNNISIQFSNSTIPTSTSVWKLYLGTQNYNYILSNAIQKNSITTKDIIFEKNTSIYRFIASSATIFTFDISKLDTNNDVNTFEIWIQMNEAQTLTFPSNVEWIDEPDLTNAGLYCFTIRFIPKVWGTMSNNDVIAIMSLSYRIDYTLNN